MVVGSIGFIVEAHPIISIVSIDAIILATLSGEVLVLIVRLIRFVLLGGQG